MSPRRPDPEPAWLARGPRSLRATALVVLFLLAQLAGFLHVSSERHEICEDHGELVHVETEVPTTSLAHVVSQADPTAQATRSLPRLRTAGTGPDRSLHEHCTFLLLNRDATSRPDAAPALAFGAPLASRPARLPRLPLVPGVPLLSLAPKHSPPA